ncbi:unnamed protein product, partial [Ectocarpus sp. 12 AP-2014]
QIGLLPPQPLRFTQLVSTADPSDVVKPAFLPNIVTTVPSVSCHSSSVRLSYAHNPATHIYPSINAGGPDSHATVPGAVCRQTSYAHTYFIGTLFCCCHRTTCLSLKVRKDFLPYVRSHYKYPYSPTLKSCPHSFLSHPVPVTYIDR